MLEVKGFGKKSYTIMSTSENFMLIDKKRQIRGFYDAQPTGL